MRGISGQLTGVVVLATLLVAPVLAEVEASLSASHVVTDAQGRERLLPAERVRPGDVIEYAVVYHNSGSEMIRNLKANLPIPAGVEYLPKSASPARVQASLDGQSFAPVPLKREVTLPDGKVEEQLVPTSEYRHLRWTLFSLKGGESSKVIARVRVSE